MEFGNLSIKYGKNSSTMLEDKTRYTHASSMLHSALSHVSGILTIPLILPTLSHSEMEKNGLHRERFPMSQEDWYIFYSYKNESSHSSELVNLGLGLISQMRY
jgi:hypothetical protein